MRKSKYLLFLLLLIECGISSVMCAVTLSVSSNRIVVGDSLTITCHITPLTTTVVFSKDGVDKGQCTAPVPNFAPGVCPANMEQNITTEITTYEITSAVENDAGVWKCTHGIENDQLTITKGATTTLTSTEHFQTTTIQGDGNKPGIIGYGVGGGCILLFFCCIAIGVYCYRRRINERKKTDSLKNRRDVRTRNNKTTVNSKTELNSISKENVKPISTNK